jgi:hypothetical protein
VASATFWPLNGDHLAIARGSSAAPWRFAGAAKAYAETGNASEAYRRAGYSKRQSTQSIHENASKLLAKVLPRVEALQADHAKRHDVTIDGITTMLREDRELAHRLGQAGAAVSASTSLAKLHGLIIDKTKVGADLRVTHEQALAEIRAALVGQT